MRLRSYVLELRSLSSVLAVSRFPVAQIWPEYTWTAFWGLHMWRRDVSKNCLVCTGRHRGELYG